METITTILGIMSLWDMIAITLNRQKKYNSVTWKAVSILTGFTLFIVWLILGIHYKKEPIWFNYMMATVYAFLTIIRVISLFDIDNEEDKKERKYYYDEESAMLRKIDEEVFDDDRPLYCASSLLLLEKREDNQDQNYNNN